jgi:hypothetical protein
MSTITLVVDKRELSTILAEMICERGPPMSATEIDDLIGRLGKGQEEPLRLEGLVEIELLQGGFRHEAKAT